MPKRIEILDADGVVINTIWASEEFAELLYPGRWRVYIEPESVAQPPPEE